MKVEPTPVNLLTTCGVHGIKPEAESEQREGNVLAIALKQFFLENLQQLRDGSRGFISVVGFLHKCVLLWNYQISILQVCVSG